jgi:tripartite ATP-independent transporter DctP family solute receptor
MKTLKKMFIAVVGLGLCSMSFAQQLTGRLGQSLPPDHPQAVAMDKFVELVGKYTDNRVNIQTFHSGALGSDDKMIQATQSGTQEVYYGALAAIAGAVKELGIFDFPFLFQNMKEVDSVMWGPMGQKLFDKVEPVGLVGVGWTEAGFRNLSNSKRQVKTAADIEGLKIRVMPNKVALDSWKALGANPTPMAFGEIYAALEIKAIDAQENPLILIYSHKYFEVNKYITITNHVFTPCAIMVSKKFWDKIKPEDQAAVRKAGSEAVRFHRGLMDAANKDVVDNLKSVGAVVDVMPPEEIQKLREKTQSVVDTYTRQIGEDFVKEFYAEIEKVRSGK